LLGSGIRDNALLPRIFDNIDAALLTALEEGLRVSKRADFSVAYFPRDRHHHLSQK